MICANPECCQPAHDLFHGTLWHLELEVPAGARTQGSEWGFPICSVPKRYFWLCDGCSARFVVKAWTLHGVRLAARALSGAPRKKFAPAVEGVESGERPDGRRGALLEIA